MIAPCLALAICLGAAQSSSQKFFRLGSRYRRCKPASFGSSGPQAKLRDAIIAPTLVIQIGIWALAALLDKSALKHSFQAAI